MHDMRESFRSSRRLGPPSKTCDMGKLTTSLKEYSKLDLRYDHEPDCIQNECSRNRPRKSRSKWRNDAPLIPCILIPTFFCDAITVSSTSVEMKCNVEYTGIQCLTVIFSPASWDSNKS